MEVIVSDDSDNEDTWNEISKINDPRIFLFKNNSGNKGIFGNLNNAINNSNGEFIQIFCQDDVMYKDFLLNQFTMLNRHNAGMTFSQFDVINDQGEVFPLEKRHNVRKLWPEFIPKDETANYLLKYGCMPGNLSPVMLQKSVFTEIGYFNQKFAYAGDLEFWSRMAGRYSFTYNSTPSLAIRRHQKQASNILDKELIIVDRTFIYSTLLQKTTFKKNKNYLQWYINQEIGVQQLYFVIKNIIKNISNISLLKYLNNYPLNIFYSSILFIITLKGRFKFFRL